MCLYLFAPFGFANVVPVQKSHQGESHPQVVLFGGYHGAPGEDIEAHQRAMASSFYDLIRQTANPEKEIVILYEIGLHQIAIGAHDQFKNVRKLGLAESEAFASLFGFYHQAGGAAGIYAHSLYRSALMSILIERIASKSPNSQIYLVSGLAHVYDGVIRKNLMASNISFAAYFEERALPMLPKLEAEDTNVTRSKQGKAMRNLVLANLREIGLKGTALELKQAVSR